jgi:hypothetical protein
MPSIIIVDKTGSVKSTNVKSLEISELYKKCGFKSASGFSLHHTWVGDEGYNLQIYGKIDGRAGAENKYEFPPPIDKILFFGSCAVINVVNDVVSDLSTSVFNSIMEKLQGGYSDIGSEGEDSEESEDIGPATKDGYQKDGFVVSDEEEDDSDVSVEEPKVLKAPKVPKVPKATKATKAKETIFAAAEKYVSQVVEKPSICIKKPTKPRAKKVEEPVQNYCSNDVTSELVEEEYLERI